MPLIIPANSISGEFEVANSLRFDDGSSDNLSRTLGTPTSQRIFTISAWIKRGELTAHNYIIGQNSTNESYFRINSSDQLDFQDRDSGSGSSDFALTSNTLLRDVSAWYHIVLSVDTTQATNTDRGKLYINGELQTLSASTYPPQNYDTMMNLSGATQKIGYVFDYFDGYMAEVCFIDGQQLDPTSFGEFDADTGIWKPIDVSGLTFGTNGFYLDFENSGSLGADVSGNGNNFTLNNLTSIDQTTDTPTNNFATGNPLAILNGNNLPTRIPDYSEGNTVATASNGTTRYLLSTFATSMPYYFEVKVLSTSSTDSSQRIGIIDQDAISTSTTYIAEYQADGVITATGETNDTGNQSITTNDIIGVAVDLATNNNVKFYHNGTLQATMSVGASYQGLSTTPYARLVDATQSFAFNFGNPAFTISSGNSDSNGMGNFEYSVPSGYYALNTKNLAEYG
jgi:hypothetical protein